MKKLLSLFLVSVAIFLVSCQKGEVPGNNQKYIGTWRNITASSSNTDSYLLTIHDDGKAEYEENSTNGASYKTVSVKGYIYFDVYNFKIGSKLINKKFKTNVSPTRVTITVQPYTYYYIATFNGVDYKKDM
jgi:hypothetical protein